MIRVSQPPFAAFAVALTIVLFVCACSHDSPLGPPTPAGATPLGGPTMESGPPPPPGWKLQPAIPETQQQAQDIVIGYLKKTLQALPPGITLDATRYSSGATVAPCQDVTSGTSPMELATNGDLTFPPGIDSEALIVKTGDIWKSWGWYVYERDGFYKPNRFGYAPDGYILQIVARYKSGYPPSLQGI
ncbi:MAG: hypothetical protein K2X56_20820 [Mycobacterium pseudokansasii]|uniref:hypothetical protein n=1 Tax=Mycobacterium pseudokansasii TaxID=2341080 RepID=UPI0010A97AFC|nr:hypothetical protein [Mycobacterium pseudokansasii]MBY0390465.1 hypothetical protein [Mycobacterium pseudokansasii]